MRKRLALRISLCLLSMICLSSCNPASSPASAVQLGGFLVGLQQVKTMLSETLGTTDVIAQNRLKQADIAVQSRIQQLDGVAKGNIQMAAAEQERMFGEIFQTLNQVGDLMEQTPREAFLQVNQTLANVATLADALPLVNVEPSIFVADPIVQDPDRIDRQVSFYGYFPGTKDGDAKATIGDRVFPLNRFPGKLAFDLPADLLKTDRKFIDITIKLKGKGLSGLFGGGPTFHHRIYVRARMPFSIAVDSYQVHPDLWHLVKAPDQFHRYADSSAQSNIGNETAPNLYVELHGDTVGYDQTSAVIVPSQTQLSYKFSTPCDSCCPHTSQAAAVAADGSTISWSLGAPVCGYHKGGCPGMFDTCGGGGSNTNVFGTLTFNVKKRGVSEQKQMDHQAFEMGRSDVKTLKVSDGWTQVKVLGTFMDGDYPVKLASDVTAQRAIDSNPYFLTKVDPSTGEVTVTTIRK